MIENKNLQPGKVAKFKEDHPIAPSNTLLITPSTANVERGFLVLGLLATKQQNCLSPSTLDKLMGIVLLVPEKFNDHTWETLVDKYRDMSDRRTDLKVS